MSSKMSNFDTQYQSKHPYKTAGTFMVAAGTLLLPSSATKIIKVHGYSISSSGTVAWSLNNAKPTGGTVDWGGILSSNVSYLADKSERYFIPYPGYICRTTSVGSALCLGTYNVGFGSGAGTVFFQCIYTDSDSA